VTGHAEQPLSTLSRSPGRLSGYAGALLAVSLAVTIRYFLDPWLGGTHVHELFLLTGALVAFLAGQGPAIVALAVGYLAGDWFFIPPRHTVSVLANPDMAAFLGLTLYTATGGIILLILDRMARTSAALREGEERLNLALDAAYAISFEWDIPKNRVRRVHSIDPVLAKTSPEKPSTIEEVREAVHPNDRTLFSDRVRAALADPQGVYESEFRVLRPDGSIAWLHERGIVQRDGRGEPRRLIGLSQDVTSRVEAESIVRENKQCAESALEEARLAMAALREANRRKDEFVAMLAHELRHPLAPIRSAAHVLRIIGHGNEKIGWAHDIIERQVAHMTRLIDDLLDVSRISRGVIRLKKEYLPLRDVVEAAVEASRPMIEARDHTLAVESGPDARVQGDRTRLVQILTNLLTNAAKFTPRGGKITIRTWLDNAQASISVRDTGVGIPKSAQERIFDLFQQEHPPVERSHSGLGIGLTLVRRLVEIHGGTVSVCSEGTGKGSEFVITIPVAMQEESQDEERSELPPISKSLQVLVIEDNPDTAESFRILLELNGHRVNVARDGFEALRLFEECPPQIAFVDLGLPGLDGFGVAQRIRAMEPRRTVLVAISGYGSEEDKRRALDAGFDEHMTKPVDHEQIHALLGGIV